VKRYPLNLDTSGMGPFDPMDPNDAACEAERKAFTDFTLKRSRLKARTGHEDAAIMIGGISSIVQIAFAIHGNFPPDTAREALHRVLDFLWLQTASIATSGETRQ
jgi:hypothetical protein